jgi:hypothetical protein
MLGIVKADGRKPQRKPIRRILKWKCGCREVSTLNLKTEMVSHISRPCRKHGTVTNVFSNDPEPHEKPEETFTGVPPAEAGWRE